MLGFIRLFSVFSVRSLSSVSSDFLVFNIFNKAPDCFLACEEYHEI